jgi:hypothetical protein
VLKAEAEGWSVLKAKPGEAGRSVLKACEAGVLTSSTTGEPSERRL